MDMGPHGPQGPLLKPTRVKFVGVCKSCGTVQSDSLLLNPYKPCENCGATFDNIEVIIERYQDGRQPFNIDRRQAKPI
jgi:hypothetical protein